MCGIAGVVCPTEAAAQSAIEAMLCVQAHRGPDDAGKQFERFGDQYLGLGHRRLSILDLSPLGHQPMVHPESHDVIVFNGEIYNFRALRKQLLQDGEDFRSTGDTEVLLRGLTRYGPAFLQRLEGMYAFAFLNRRDQTLLLARDPMGIKPLYIGKSNDALVFASEVRGVLSSGLIANTLDKNGIATMLAFGAVQHPHTIFEHIRSFPPGHYQVLKANAASDSSPIRFWQYPEIDTSMTESEAVIKIESTMDAAVRDHLESDVPVGVFLSSGLDSTVIAAIAAKHSRTVRSFTVGFADQPDLSEMSLARETAKHFGMDHTEVNVNGDTAEQSTVRWLQSLDQPSVDGLNVYIISQAVRDIGIKVALSGQGGDELFGGYPSFRDVPRMRRWMTRLHWLPVGLRVALAQVATTSRSKAAQEKLKDIMRTDGSLLALYLQRRRAMSSAQLRALGIDEAIIQSQSQAVIAQAVDALSSTDEIAQMSRFESSLYQGNMLLRDGDANGMAHGLEIRLPMLDRRLLDLMHRIPGAVRLPNGIANKHLMRRAFAPYLRSTLLNQPKRGFTLPIRRWMVGPLRELCEHALIHLKTYGLFDPRGVDSLWSSFLREPESPMWTRAFTLCVIGLYLRETTDLMKRSHCN